MDLNNIEINQSLLNFKKYDGLFNCFDDIYSCFLGFFCPSCLFGETYKKAGFGNCLTGFFKMFSLQFITSFIFLICYLNVQYNLLYKNISPYIEDIYRCEKNNQTCITHNIDYYDTNCLKINMTNLCKCLEKPIMNYCYFNQNELPNIINDLTTLTLIINGIHFITISCLFGFFSGYYRRKISHKFAIRENTQKTFWIHCCPITHLLALCQEYKTIIKYMSREKFITPVQPIQVMHIEQKKNTRANSRKSNINTNFMV